jgi:hypothetical protein
VSEPPDDFPRAQPRQRFSDFELIAKIGDGGSAEVFRARNLTFDVEVALKRWYRPPTADEQRKFIDECRLHWRLSDHPNIVRLYWADAPTGQQPWLATELCDESLAARIARGDLSVHESWRIAQDVLSGLAAVHRLGHLHRDVKPANVLLKGGRAALCDLGISMAAGGSTRYNAAGTDDYVAPELVAGAVPSFRSDVYSAGRTIGGLFPAHRPPRLDALLRRATSPDPGKRPEDAVAFLGELAAAGRSPARRPRGRVTRNRVLVAASVVGILAAGTAALAIERRSGIPAAGPSPSTTATSAPVTPSPSRPAATSAGTPAPVRPTTAPPSSTRPAKPCANRVAAGEPIKYSRSLFSSPAGATESSSGATTTVRFDNQYTWAGLMLKLPRGTCSYRLDLEARMIEPAREMNDDEGWGYGIGPCNLLTNGRPFGYSLQHAMIKTDGAVSGNSGTFRNPAVNAGKTIDVPADYGWHQWTFEVDAGQVRVTREFGVTVTSGPVSGGAGLPANCDNAGVFLRVFNGAAGFRDISFTGL